MRRKMPPFAAICAFEATARLGSMKKASEELRLTPSALSHQVKALEVLVGTALFERAPGRLTLTDAGTHYLKDICTALELIEAATAKVSRGGETNHITIHIAHSLSELWFVPLMKTFYRDHPEILLSVVTNPSAADFANGVADISISYEKIGDGAQQQFLFEDVLSPCCSPSFLQQNGPINNPAKLLEFPLIWCDSEPDEWRFWFSHTKVNDFHPERWVRFDSRADALQAAREGLGIAMGRRPYSSNLSLSRPRLVQMLDLAVATGSGYRLITPPRTEFLAKIKTFTAWLTQICRDDFEPGP